MKTRFLLLLVGVMLLVCGRADAWGTKEHILITRLAVNRLLDDPATPQGLKDFLRQSTPDLTDLAGSREYFMNVTVGAEPKDLKGLSHWVIVPDLRANNEKNKILEPFGVNEFNMHFIDLEYLNTDPEKSVYKDDLSSLGDVKAFPRDHTDPRYKKAGMLPFAVKMSYEKLVEAFKLGRLAPQEGVLPAEDNALRWAGYLAHYAGDNLQPLHATQDYKSASYFGNKRAAPNVHSEMEWRMNDDTKELFPELRAEYWDAWMAAIKDASDPTQANGKLDDPWMETLMISDMAYRQLPLVGRAAMAAAGQPGTPDKPVGNSGPFDTAKFFKFADPANPGLTVLQMKARQQAIAVVRVQSLIRRAWDAAHADQK